jgi:transposase
MRNTNKIIAFLTSSAFVTVPLAQPESDIAIPVEKTEMTQSAPDLGQKQKEDWQRLREERKQARQQILSDIKANAQAEHKDIQQDIVQQKMKNNAENENRGNVKENVIHKGPRENGPEEPEKIKPENPPFDVPRPDEHGPFHKGPKI